MRFSVVVIIGTKVYKQKLFAVEHQLSFTNKDHVTDRVPRSRCLAQRRCGASGDWIPYSLTFHIKIKI